MAIKLLNLPKGSEVILPSFTWIACANAIVLNELIPVFCDVDPWTCNVTVDHIKAVVGPKTSAVMVVHYGGKPVDIDPIRQLGFPIIEDAAHAIDSFYKGKHCGTLGDTAIFSFDAVKNLTTGEGGGVICQNPDLYQRARKLRYCGIGKSGFQASASKTRWWEYEISEFFPKMLNTDMAAYIGTEQLKKLPSFQKHRKAIWDRYNRAFSEDWGGEITIPAQPESHEQHSYFTYWIRLPNGRRDALAKYLYDRGIYTSLRFHPLHLNPIYQSKASLPFCEELNETMLNLPLHHRLSDEDVGKVIQGIKDYLESC